MYNTKAGNNGSSGALSIRRGPDDLPEGGTENGFEGKGSVREMRHPQLAGVLEVFSPFPNAFSRSTQTLLEDFARECARIRDAAAHLKIRPPAEVIALDGESADSEPLTNAGLSTASEYVVPTASAGDSLARADNSLPGILGEHRPYEIWTLILGALVILAAAGVSFMIGSRVGWLRTSAPASTHQPAPVAASTAPPVSAVAPPAEEAAKPADVSKPSSEPSSEPKSSEPKRRPVRFLGESGDGKSADSSDELVVYEKGKVVFRMKPPHAVHLAPDQAETLLLDRVEPQYPAAALAAHRSGDVTLEVRVAEDGTVSSIRTVKGDHILAAAAAQAVRNWHYQPYRAHDRPAQFQTDVTLRFSLPN
jgi:protein TonB